LLAVFPDLADMSVVDLGGTTNHWARAPVVPRRLVLLNSVEGFGAAAAHHAIETVRGDACAPPESLRDERFDLVYSNSVLEHVGGPWRRSAFADGVHALAQRHWIQTPYRYFPLEPHWLFPGFRFLPVRARAEVTRYWPVGHRHERAKDVALDLVLEVDLVSKTEMRHLFPQVGYALRSPSRPWWGKKTLRTAAERLQWGDESAEAALATHRPTKGSEVDTPLPQSALQEERLLGTTKSLVAVRG
jgi:hypothetical protein